MRVTNQELYECHMPQVIYEDEINNTEWWNDTDKANKVILKSMYKVQDVIYKLFIKCDIREIEANTIDPMRQNAFLPLKKWNINLDGCFAEVSIHQRLLEGCYAEIEII